MTVAPKTSRLRLKKRTARKNGAGKQRDASSRKVMIADAVIEVLGRSGARGLTHREIDRHLKLPDGSTSYYFRRKEELICAGLERMNALTLERQCKRYADIFARAEQGSKIVVGDFAEIEFKTYLEYRNSPASYRHLALVELFIMAIRDSSLMENQRRTMLPIFEIDEKMFSLLGARNPRHAAAEYGDFRRGSFMTFVLVPNAMFGRDRTLEYYENVIEKIIAESNKMPSDLSPQTDFLTTISSDVRF